jgi:O-methyltransferase involved in polyketide biosynthesis
MNRTAVSATARLVAAATVLAGYGAPGESLPPPDASALSKRFLRTSFSGALLVEGMRHGVVRFFWRMVERLTHPGIVAHYARRKHLIEGVVREGIATGARHVVVYGAGFDTLVCRLAREFPDVVFTETDLPATQAAKRRALTTAPYVPAPNVEFARSDEIDRVLRRHEDTLVIAEAVLMYVGPGAVDEFFETLCNSPASRLRVVFTYMRQRPDGVVGFLPRSRLVSLWLRFVGEPFRWAESDESMPEWLSHQGFSNSRIVTSREFSGIDGESVAIAERG